MAPFRSQLIESGVRVKEGKEFGGGLIVLKLNTQSFYFPKILDISTLVYPYM